MSQNYHEHLLCRISPVRYIKWPSASSCIVGFNACSSSSSSFINLVHHHHHHRHPSISIIIIANTEANHPNDSNIQTNITKMIALQIECKSHCYACFVVKCIESDIVHGIISIVSDNLVGAFSVGVHPCVYVCVYLVHMCLGTRAPNSFIRRVIVRLQAIRGYYTYEEDDGSSGIWVVIFRAFYCDLIGYLFCVWFFFELKSLMSVLWGFITIDELADRGNGKQVIVIHNNRRHEKNTISIFDKIMYTWNKLLWQLKKSVSICLSFFIIVVALELFSQASPRFGGLCTNLFKIITNSIAKSKET